MASHLTRDFPKTFPQTVGPRRKPAIKTLPFFPRSPQFAPIAGFLHVFRAR
jgi:hypothetical protein